MKKTAPTPRLGRFSLSHDFISSDEDAARAVMGRCVVLRCENQRSGIEYVAISPDFETLSASEDVPHYEVRITQGGKRIIFKKTGENS